MITIKSRIKKANNGDDYETGSFPKLRGVAGLPG